MYRNLISALTLSAVLCSFAACGTAPQTGAPSETAVTADTTETPDTTETEAVTAAETESETMTEAADTTEIPAASETAAPAEEMTAPPYPGADDAEQAPANTGSAEIAEDVYAGTYIEEIAGRGVITVTRGEDITYHVSIRWSGSAYDYSVWEFSGEFNGRGVLHYTDCVKTHYEYTSEDAETPETETVYTDGTGYLKMSEEGTKTGVIWSDDKEDAAADCFFVKG
jgi:hypothetical protein